MRSRAGAAKLARMSPYSRSVFRLLAASLFVGGACWFCCAGLSLHLQHGWGWLDTVLFGGVSVVIFFVCAFAWFAAHHDGPPPEDPRR